MDEAETYRERAASARSRARSAALPKDRRTFETLAAAYEALAMDAEWMAGNADPDKANTQQLDQPPTEKRSGM